MFCDAHNHLHDARLAPWRSGIIAEMERVGIRHAMVNGTREDDWDTVSALTTELDFIEVSFGLHPWHVASRSQDWLEKLVACLDSHPNCGVGEIGLDRWIEGHDLPDQLECFKAQLAIAAERNLPVTIHCLRAWGALWDVVREHPLPAPGFLLHAYGGPAEMVEGFVGKGAYFSFSSYFLHDRKAPQREVFRTLPADRILVETDAPDMAPPPALNPHPLAGNDGKVLNHPANLLLAYETLAELRQWGLDELCAQVNANYSRLFGRSK